MNLRMGLCKKRRFRTPLKLRAFKRTIISRIILNK